MKYWVGFVVLALAGCQSSQIRKIAEAGTDPTSIPDFNYKLSDVRTSGVTKEEVFKNMDPDHVILTSASVCANRALVWGWNMKRKYNIDSGKIFVFYSNGFFTDPEYLEASGRQADEIEKVWWYHVAPYVIDNGKEVVLDHGFNAESTRSPTPSDEITQPWNGSITRPLTLNEWLLRFPKTAKCKELTASDTSYTDYMRRGASLPSPASGGSARCYYRKVPMQYWMPLSIAMKELGKNAKGTTLNPPFTRENFYQSDLFRACEEAVSDNNKLSQMFGKNDRLKTCAKFMGFDQPLPGFATLTPIEAYEKKLKKRVDKAIEDLRN